MNRAIVRRHFGRIITKCTVAAAVAVAGAAAVPAAAANPVHDAPPGVRQVLRDISYLAPLQGVDLTDTQRAQIEAIEKSGWSKLLPQLGTVIKTHEQIIGALARPHVSIAEINALEKKQRAALVVIETQRIEMAVAVHNLLTPAQIAQEAATHVQQVDALEEWIRKLLG